MFRAKNRVVMQEQLKAQKLAIKWQFDLISAPRESQIRKNNNKWDLRDRIVSGLGSQIYYLTAEHYANNK